mmetsp:Transcript_3288/g.4633  ORF Transcript_3288/g.4633 Transcript_3288/m.4633 type:complete len:354 (-) Transcript_3288:102-1163(-)|eukprot:CAMPEP_0117771888 /NCGR_PEP_ID=MMETSP0947-20121206/24739_1 /TAXON_ID=44440 /ORGANISM="Chattonella subsalsa, Strain CCMP2191" /LENGTH=353 /DNA_ID=CAMNT_0005597347 /DNA_START=180 /DNA_END=1241 /DNA_ORIENTATION=+
MGSCLSKEDKDALQKSKELDAINQRDFQEEEQKRKLLLLGAGESGKSTIFKQMKILYGVPLTEAERRHQTPYVYNNIIQGVKIVVNQLVKFELHAELKDTDAFKKIFFLDDNVVIDEKVGKAIKVLWKHPCTQEVWDRRNEFQVTDNVKYFCENMDRIMHSDYLASQEDLLQTRIRTTGVVTEKYVIDGAIFEMYDVGGQRNERKKWIHCFDNVTSVIFVAALSEYDQVLFEDDTKNRMVEAIELFGEACNNRFFQETSMILFLNKKDIFEEKVEKKNISSVPDFNDFTGGLGDYKLGVQYFLDHFLKMSQNTDRQIFHHVTCATDTGNVKVVFEAIKDTLLRNNLKDTGLMD